MTTIHMETEQIHQAARRLGDIASQMLVTASKLRSTRGRLSLAWQGGHSDGYHQSLLNLIRRYENQIQDLEVLALRLSREVDEWCQADSIGVDHLNAINITQPEDLARQWNRSSFIIDGHTDYYLLRGIERKAYEGYLAGDLTLKETLDFINKDPFQKKIVKPSITFYDIEESGKLAFLDGQTATRFGNFGGSIGSLEQNASGKIIFEDGTLQAKGEMGAGAYLAKGTYDAEMAGVGIAALGFVGAEANASGAIAFDPKKGEIGAKAEVDAFAGGKLEGSVTAKGDIAGIEGEVKAKGGISYGVGVSGKAEVGFSQGHIRGEFQVGATLGLGAEFGISADLDVQQAATTVIDAGKNAVDWLFND